MNYYNTHSSEFDKLKLILSNFNVAILLESKDRTIEYVNQAFCTLFKIKVSVDNVIGSSCEEGVISASFQFKNPSRFIYRIEEIIEEHNQIRGEEVHLRDGRIFIRDYTPIFNDNILTGHLWFYREVLKEDKIIIPEASIPFNLFEELINSIDLSISILDRDKHFLFINHFGLKDARRKCYLLGKTEQEYFKYFSIEVAESNLKNECFIKTINDGSINKFEELSKDFMGVECYKRTTYCPLTISHGVVEKVLSYSIDLSKEKLAIDQLKADIDLFNYSLNTINEAVFISNGNLELNYSNYSFQTFLLHEKPDPNTIFDFISVQNYDFYKHLFSVLSGEVHNLSGRIKFPKTNGTPYWYKYNIHKGLDSNSNKQNGIVTVLDNITEEVELEQNLLELVKKEKELNELKSAFVNMVSHEMRTPLAIISSCAELIQLMLTNGKPKEDIEAYAGHIINEVERMTAFMNDILIISKIEAGKIEFNPEHISLNDFLNDILKKSYLPWKDNRNLELTFRGSVIDFAFDNKMLRHILQNLLDNAFKYSANKNSPKLRVRYSKNFATFSVIDYGIGIHPEDIEKLFSSFARGRNVGNIYGTGVGLVVVKYFVDLHKGVISVKSKLNIGTIFSIKLPY